MHEDEHGAPVPSEHRVMFVSASAAALASLRSEASDFLRPHLPTHVHGDVLMALHETVTNALVHGAGASVVVHVGLKAEHVTLTVRDTGAGFNVQELVEQWPPASDAEGGRGIYLATRLMDSVTVFTASGTIVHASRALAGDRDRQHPVCVWSSLSVARFAHDTHEDACMRGALSPTGARAGAAAPPRQILPA